MTHLLTIDPNFQQDIIVVHQQSHRGSHLKTPTANRQNIHLMKAIESKKQAWSQIGRLKKLSFCVEEKRTRLDFGTALNFIYSWDVNDVFPDTGVKTWFSHLIL